MADVTDEEQLEALVADGFLRAATLAASKELRAEFDECWGDALAGALRGIRTWHPDGGASQRTWVARHVRWDVIAGHRARTGWRGPDAPRPWSLDQLMEAAVPGASLADVLPDPDSGRDLDHVEARVALDQALAVLDPLNRALVVEHHVQGRTCAAIAAERGMRREAVNARIRYSLARVRQAVS